MNTTKTMLIAFAFAILCLRIVFAQTPHLISLQGYATDSSDEPLLSGDVAIRIYDAPTGGILVYDSDTDFNSAIYDGIFDVLLGSITPLDLDNTVLYYMEVDLNGEEVVGDATTGRQEFWPGSGSHANLQNRVTGTCPGEVVVGINQDGSVSCETDDIGGPDSDWVISGSDMYSGVSGNVGIGTPSPSGKLQVQDGSVLFAGSTGAIPITGTGVRLMWYPSKAAFRAGYAMNQSWNDPNIGLMSFAVGYSPEASGEASTAMGRHTIASGEISTAMGCYTRAIGDGSTAMGYDITVSGTNSVGIGLDASSHTVSADHVMSIMGGNVGIGDVSPDSELEVAGTVAATDFECSNCIDGGDLAPDALGGVRHFEWMYWIQGSGNIYDNGYVKIQKTTTLRTFRLYCGHPSDCTYVYYLNGARTGGTLSNGETVDISMADDGDDVRFLFAKRSNGMDMLTCDVFDTNHNWVHFMCHDTK